MNECFVKRRPNESSKQPDCRRRAQGCRPGRAVIEAAPVEEPNQLGDALATYEANMTRDEAGQHLVELLIVWHFVNEKMRLLMNDRIEDGAVAPQLASAVRRSHPAGGARAQIDPGVEADAGRRPRQVHPIWPQRRSPSTGGQQDERSSAPHRRRQVAQAECRPVRSTPSSRVCQVSARVGGRGQGLNRGGCWLLKPPARMRALTSSAVSMSITSCASSGRGQLPGLGRRICRCRAACPGEAVTAGKSGGVVGA